MNQFPYDQSIEDGQEKECRTEARDGNDRGTNQLRDRLNDVAMQKERGADTRQCKPFRQPRL
jgi:hypothetical protein